jgi:hypothetical protein
MTDKILEECKLLAPLEYYTKLGNDNQVSISEDHNVGNKGSLEGKSSEKSVNLEESSTANDSVFPDANMDVYLKQIAAQEKDDHTTTLIILPQLGEYDVFLHFIELLEDLIETEELDEYVQIASFHPNYQFAESDSEDVSNYSNRSPYPTVHLLRVSDVSKAVDQYDGNTDEIWQKNIATLNSLGIKNARNMLQSIVDRSTSM